MRRLGFLLMVALAAVVPGTAVAEPREGTPASKVVAGTPCEAFPADNYWRADISALPRHDRSRQWLARMSSDRDLHPDFGPSYGDGPN